MHALISRFELAGSSSAIQKTRGMGVEGVPVQYIRTFSDICHAFVGPPVPETRRIYVPTRLRYYKAIIAAQTGSIRTGGLFLFLPILRAPQEILETHS